MSVYFHVYICMYIIVYLLLSESVRGECVIQVDEKLPEVWECTSVCWYRERPAQKSLRRLEYMYINTRKSWFALNYLHKTWRLNEWCPEARGTKLIELITAHAYSTHKDATVELNSTCIVVFSNMLLILGDIVGSTYQLHTSTSPGSSLATLHLWSNTLWIRRREERKKV